MADWSLLVDWDRNNSFADAYDDITADVTDQITWSLGCRAFKPIADEMELRFTVWNEDRKYSPEYASSPLYGKMLPNVPVQLKFGTEVMWSGVLKNIKPAPLKFGKRRATVVCSGIKWLLDRIQVYTDLYQNVTADVVIRAILLGVVRPPVGTTYWVLGVPGYTELGVTTRLGAITDLMALDEGVEVFEYIGDNIQESAIITTETKMGGYQVISDLVTAERGLFYFNRAGKAVFWNQNKLLDYSAVDVTIDNTADDFKYATPADELVNRVKITCFPRSESATNTEILWSLDGTMPIPAGAVRDIYVNYKTTEGSGRGAKDVQTPAGGDLVYTGAGTLIASVDAGGQQAKITIQNTNAYSECEITTLVLRGRVISSVYPLEVVEEDLPSIKAHGLHSKKFVFKHVNSPAQAKDIAEFMLWHRLYHKKILSGRAESVDLVDQPADESHEQIAYTMGHKILLNDFQLNHSAEYLIVGEQHTLDSKSKELKTRWYLERAGKRLTYSAC